MRAAAATTSHEAHLEDLMTNGKPMTKLDLSDGRIIPCGTLLRAAGIDELPQVFNIIRGEMSLVGPRPCLDYEYKKFKPEHAARFDVLPGLTGLWQVSGKNKTTFGQMIELDIAYAKKLSLWRDVMILARTLPVIFQQMFEVVCRKCGRLKRHLIQNSSSSAKRSVL